MPPMVLGIAGAAGGTAALRVLAETGLSESESTLSGLGSRSDLGVAGKVGAARGDLRRLCGVSIGMFNLGT